MWHFASSLDESCRLVAIVARWAWRLEGGCTYTSLTLRKLDTLRELYPWVDAMYDAVYADLLEGLCASDRLRSRPVLGLWERWLDLVMGRRAREF